MDNINQDFYLPNLVSADELQKLRDGNNVQREISVAIGEETIALTANIFEDDKKRCFARNQIQNGNALRQS